MQSGPTHDCHLRARHGRREFPPAAGFSRLVAIAGPYFTREHDLARPTSDALQFVFAFDKTLAERPSSQHGGAAVREPESDALFTAPTFATDLSSWRCANLRDIFISRYLISINIGNHNAWRKW